MKSDIQLYCDAMAEIRDRINVVSTILCDRIHIGLPGQPPLQDQRTELVFVQLRKVLEGIAFASLSANREEYAEVRERFSADWNATRILDCVKRVNPNFWPVPIGEPIETERGLFHFREAPLDGVFTRDDFERLYTCCAEVLHLPNPYKGGSATVPTANTIENWVRRIQRLLGRHRVGLLSGDVWVVEVPGDGPVRVLLGRT